MAGLHFDITADNTNLKQKLQEVERGIKETSSTIEHEGGNIDILFQRMTRAAAAFGASFTAKELVQNIIQVRGEFQQLEVAFTTMLGSKGKADKLMSQLVETAAKTPFDLQGVANGARQLLAYGTSAEEVNETLIRLGNIAAGLSIPLNDLVYLYGTTMTQGRLYTQDLNQFTGRGIPMIKELAKEFGVAENEIKGMVEAGKIGFPEVQKVINNLTNEGGMFFNLMQEQSKTITGQISNIGDSFSTMLNEIGKSNESVINTALSGVSYLVENYEKVGEVILAAATMYGSYKAVLMSVTAVQKLNTAVLRQAVLEKGLATSAGIALSNAEAIAAARTKILTLAQRGLVSSLKAVAAATVANPYLLAAAAITTLVAAVYKYATTATAAEEAADRLNKTVGEVEGEVSNEISALKSLDKKLSETTKGTDEWNNVKNEIITGYSKYLPGLEEEIEKTGNLADKYGELEKAIRKAAAARSFEAIAQKEDKEYTELRDKNLKKVYEAFTKRYGDKDGLKVYRTWLSYLDSGKALPAEAEKIFSKTATNFWNTETANTLLYDIRKQDEIRKANLEKFKNIYGLSDSDISKVSETENNKEIKAETKSAENLAKAYKEAEKAYNDASAALERITANREKYTQKEYKEAVESLKSAKDAFEELGGSAKGRVLKRTTNTSDNAAKERLDAEKRLNEELLSLQQKNQTDSISLDKRGTERKLAEIHNEYDKRIAEIKKQETRFKEENAKAGISGLNADGLTGQQSSALQEARENAAKWQEQQEQEVYAASARAMQEYLKQYGTFQQQKLAIAEEYAEKIKNAETEGERLSLQAESNRAIQQVEINAIKQQIDWGSVFSDFGTMFKAQLQPTIDELRKISQSDTFKQSSLEEQKVLYELISKLENANAAWDSDIFKRVSDDIKVYQESMTGYAEAVDKARKAEESLAKAKSDLAKANESGDANGIKAAQSAVDEAMSAFNAASVDVSAFGAQVQESTSALNTSSGKAAAMFNGLSESLRGLSSGSLEGIGNGIMKLDKLFGGELTKNAGNALAKGFQSLLGKDSQAAKTLSKALGDSGLAGEIISGVLGILDLLSAGIGGIVSNLTDTVFGSVNGLLDDLFTGDIIMKPVKSVTDGVEHILDTVTFGGFTSWISSSNGEEVRKAIERLTERNENLNRAIETLKDDVGASKGSLSVSAYNRAYAYQEEANKNYLEMARKQAGYHGSHHSFQYYWEGYTEKEIEDFSKKIGREWSGKLWDLSPEEMEQLAAIPEMWEKILDTGKGDYGERVAEKLEDYMDQAGKLEDLTNDFYEGLTNISFDSLYDGFVDTLMDMESSAQDFSDDLTEYFTRAMVSNKVGELFSEKLEDWYGKFGEAMKDNDLSDDERNSLREEYMGYVEEAMKLRDEIASATGYDSMASGSSQESTKKGFATASQDSIDELNGRFTSIQLDTSVIRELMATCNSNLTSLRMSADGIKQHTDEIRNLSLLGIDYLEAISRNTNQLYEMNERLGKIEKNTRNL